MGSGAQPQGAGQPPAGSGRPAAPPLRAGGRATGVMIAIEEQEAELAERQARLRQIETTQREEHAVLQAEKDDLVRRLAELEEQRAGLRRRLRAADLDTYDHLRRQQGGTAVALLKRAPARPAAWTCPPPWPAPSSTARACTIAPSATGCCTAGD